MPSGAPRMDWHRSAASCFAELMHLATVWLAVFTQPVKGHLGRATPERGPKGNAPRGRHGFFAPIFLLGNSPHWLIIDYVDDHVLGRTIRLVARTRANFSISLKNNFLGISDLGKNNFLSFQILGKSLSEHFRSWEKLFSELSDLGKNHFLSFQILEKIIF